MRELIDAGNRLALLPPRSQGLDTPDYTALDSPEKWLARTKPIGVGTWEKGCEVFKRHLQSLDPVELVEN